MNLQTVYDVLANGAAYTYVLVDRTSPDPSPITTFLTCRCTKDVG
jgi:hypothetical protein